MQVLTPPKTESYSNQDGHFIKTFLISSKANEAGWQVSKDTLQEKVQSFIGKPFVIIPDDLSSTRQKGHIFADTKDQLLEDYKKHTHGIISSISEPFKYNDGTDDIFYMANVKLSGSKAAAALMEHGTNTWIPFAVSPHIWANDGVEPHSDWEGISLSLVPQGAYGQEAVITKYCNGEEHACNNSLAATLCSKEDAGLAASISSLVSNSQTNSIMSTTVQQVPQVNEVNKQVQTQQPIQEEKPQVEETKGVTLSQEEYDKLKKEVKAKKEADELVSKLITKDRTNTLNNIFKSVKDESVKKDLFDKYFNLKVDADILNDFSSDLTKHVFPSLVEEAKAQAEKELMNKTVEENKGKSKAGSLPREPELPKEKEGSLVPNSVNEVLRLKRLMTGGF